MSSNDDGDDIETNSVRSNNSIVSSLGGTTCFKFASIRHCGGFRCAFPQKFIFLAAAVFIQLIGLIFAITMISLGNTSCSMEGIVVGVLAFSAGLMAPSPLSVLRDHIRGDQTSS